MSFLNQTVVATLDDVLDELETFLTGTPGWVVDRDDPDGEIGIRKTPSGIDIGFAGQFNTSTPNNLGIYQFHGAVYSTASAPWDQNDDSGNGAASTVDATLGLNRHAPITDTPQFLWCFEDDDYFHAVVQVDDDDFVHFGAGNLIKYNDWVGGEYVYGHKQNSVVTSSQAVQGNTSILMDGFSFDAGGDNNMEEYAATVHCESFTNQPASGLYAVCLGNQASGNLGDDRQTVPVGRLHFNGGFRGGMFPAMMGQFAGTFQRGLVPIYPIVINHWNRTTDNIAPLGEMPDIGGVSIRNFSPGQEVTVGADTWNVFPSARKARADTEAGAGFSQYQGIAYRQVTT